MVQVSFDQRLAHGGATVAFFDACEDFRQLAFEGRVRFELRYFVFEEFVHPGIPLHESVGYTLSRFSCVSGSMLSSLRPILFIRVFVIIIFNNSFDSRYGTVEKNLDNEFGSSTIGYSVPLSNHCS